MDVAVDLYLVVPLLFTVLALVLVSIFMRLRGAEEQPREPVKAEAARKSGPGDQAAVVEQQEEAVEERKEAAAEQQEHAAEEPSPAAEPSPAMAESIPQKSPTQPQEDAGDHAAFPSKAEEEDLD